jgi:hypothetical protein
LDALIGSLEAKVSELKSRKKNIASLSLSRQMEIQDMLKEADMNIDEAKIDV